MIIILYKIEAFIKIINNSNKDIIFFNGFFIKPSKLYHNHYNNIYLQDKKNVIVI